MACYAEGAARGRGKKKRIIVFLPILGHFWYSVVTLITLNSNLYNLKTNQEKSKKVII